MNSAPGVAPLLFTPIRLAGLAAGNRTSPFSALPDKA
jgi:hypothetical protein